MNKDIRKKYKSIIDDKMSVTFSSMEEEPNKMPYNETWNKIYKVYIPEAYVEVMACEVITYSIEEDETNSVMEKIANNNQ